jgi:16S rRNA (guanine527-N7)-methyltransferase
LLIECNQKINLTTITEYNEVVKKHFLDSSLLLRLFPTDSLKNKMAIDVGTGAGFPGIPLSILLPETNFLLVDSLNKRIDFLHEVVKKLELKNVKLVHGRAEDLGQNSEYREQFDFCISRAVAPLPLLLEYCSPFIKKDGYLYLYKSKKSQEEIEQSTNALDVLNCKLENNYELAKEEDYVRYLLIIKKYENTPEKYPRKAGKPKKKPL